MIDFRDWGITSLDTWGDASDNIAWMSENQCILLVNVFSKKIQHFAMEKGIINKDIVQFFFDYDEAYQACLDKLADLRRHQL
ncbi:hypothetical protein L4C34_02530 [Vibrio profundum]|uniref:hypothetical protein n=1 Tax=Vibrio profundum TaxID=2910247 RepID=UPI003D0A88BA